MKCPHCNKEFEEFKVEIWEHERGWGGKIDQIKTFHDRQKALDFIEKFNSKNTATSAPDWYMVAKKRW